VQLTDSLEEKLLNYGSERDRGHILDVERRELFASKAFLRAAQLSQPFEQPAPEGTPLHSIGRLSLVESGESAIGAVEDVTTGLAAVAVDEDSRRDSTVLDRQSIECSSSSSSSSSGVRRDGAVLRAAVPPRSSSVGSSSSSRRDPSPSICLDSAVIEAAVAAADTAMGDLDYLLGGEEEEEESEYDRHKTDSSSTSSSSSKTLYGGQLAPTDRSGYSTLKVIFDGVNRAVCDFKIKLVAGSELDDKELGGGHRMKGTTRVRLSGDLQPYRHSEHSDSSWIEDNLISAVADEEDIAELNSLIPRTDTQAHETPCPLAVVTVDQSSSLDEDYPVILGRKTVRPKVEDDVISRMLHVDRLSYTGELSHASLFLRTLPHSLSSQPFTSLIICPTYSPSLLSFYLHSDYESCWISHEVYNAVRDTGEGLTAVYSKRGVGSYRIPVPQTTHMAEGSLYSGTRYERSLR
jgi:hypothetical protein